MNYFRLSDGRRLAWREAGRGRPLVLLHGWSLSSAVFDEALAALATEFRVLAPDLRGHGDSDPGPGYAFAELAADLRQWLTALQLSRFSLLGWSLGGQVALELCGMSDGAVERLLLIATTPRFTAGADWAHGLPEGQVQAMARNLKRDYRQTMAGFRDLMLAGEETLTEERRQQIEALTGAPPPLAVALAALDGLRHGDQRALLATIACPTLVMHGDLDRIALPGAGRFLAEGIAGARLARLPGVAHAPFLGCPHQVFRQWREFLA